MGAAATANANATTRRDPPSVAIAQLGMSTTERRAAKTSTSARKTTAAATANAHAPTRRDPPSVKIVHLGMSTTERRAANVPPSVAAGGPGAAIISTRRLHFSKRI